MIDHLGMRESPIGSNRGDTIDLWNKNVIGIIGQPWCATASSNLLRNGNSTPEIWTGRALDYEKSGYSYSLRAVRDGFYKVKAGDKLVWDYGAGRGHVDDVLYFNNSDTVYKYELQGNEIELEPDEWLVIGANRSDAVRITKFRTNYALSQGAKSVTEIQGYYGNIATASIYSDKLHGGEMANGDTYNMNKLTVAHKKLPFGTFLQLINPITNRKVIVQVTDRGPYIEGRDLDLSNETARQLGLKDGVHQLLCEVVNVRSN